MGSSLHFERWTTWWPGVLDTEVINRGDAHRFGFHTRQTWKAALPYKLNFETTVEDISPMSLIRVKAGGDLEGTGYLRFEKRNDQTIFQVDWIVSPTKLWMKLLTPLLRGIFAWNHRVLMDWGAKGLSRKLGIPTITTSTEGVLPPIEIGTDL